MPTTCPHCSNEINPSDQFCPWCGSNLQDEKAGAEPATGRAGELQPGYVLRDRYQIEGLLGRGGMGAVYRARDLRLPGKAWAVKEMTEAGLEPAERVAAVQNFEREAHLLAQLQHPNLPQVVDFFEDGSSGRHYLVMDFVEGQTLEELLLREGSPFPETVINEWTFQLCDVLGYLHGQNPPIIFRDLKPGNIIIEPSGQLKLIDFGIARFFKGDRSSDTQTFGTFGYAPPEQYGLGQTDARSDIYGLGVTLLRLSTGYDPAIDPLNLPPARQVNPAVSARLEKVIQKATHQDPDARYQSAAELQNALLVSETKIPWLPILIGLVVVAAILGVLLLVTNDDEPEEAGATLTATVDPASVAEEPEQPASSTPTTSPTATASATATATETPAPTITPTPSPTIAPTPDLGPETLVLGQSVSGADIEAVRFGSGPNSIILVGGLHAGFAPGSVSVAQRAITHFGENPDEVPAETTIYVISSLSPDSPYDPGELPGRFNGRGVDINRNWDCNWTRDARVLGQTVNGSGGSAPFSEPETMALQDLIDETRPRAVVFWEAKATDGLSSPGSCGAKSVVSGQLAQTYGLAAGYKVADFEELTNQQITGDASNWLDREGIPSIAVLLPEYTAVDWNNNLAGIRAVIRESSR
ncbi:MAG: protein kinase [Chloroflexota bacterium]|nr:MAG: protein kinase [Chloroflexota bacterium]